MLNSAVDDVTVTLLTGLTPRQFGSGLRTGPGRLELGRSRKRKVLRQSRERSGGRRREGSGGGRGGPVGPVWGLRVWGDLSGSERL